jgi:hypothetical protein
MYCGGTVGCGGAKCWCLDGCAKVMAGCRVALRSDERCRATNGGMTRQVQSQTYLLRFPNTIILQTYISSDSILQYLSPALSLCSRYQRPCPHSSSTSTTPVQSDSNHRTISGRANVHLCSSCAESKRLHHPNLLRGVAHNHSASIY